MWTFAMIAGGIGLVTAILIVRPLFAGRVVAPGRDLSDTEVFRDQLAEVDRDLAKGAISETEAEGARVEISRRLLKAAAGAEAEPGIAPAPQGHSGLLAGLALIGTPALAAALYIGIGAPGVPDQPLAERAAAQAPDRPSQEEMQARIAAQTPPAPSSPEDAELIRLVGQLEEKLVENPDDLRGLELYATMLMRLERWAEAWKVKARVIALKTGGGTAEDYAQQAEAMVMATGGYVSPEAEQIIARALQRDPESHVARYYAGLALAQNGNVAEAIRLWEALRAEAPVGAPWVEWLDMMLAEAKRMQGGPQAPAGGPSQADIAAAQQLSPEERQAMIEGMVQRLRDRLTTEGGSPEEWGRLISSYATLNQMDAAREAYEMAIAAHPEGPGHAALNNLAARMGLIEQAAAPGPTQQDIAAARQMTPEDRQAMIEGMVQRLEDRLTTEGGEIEEWYRLMNAYVQLDRKDEAARVYNLAIAAWPDATSSGFMREQALLLGVPIE